MIEAKGDETVKDGGPALSKRICSDCGRPLRVGELVYLPLTDADPRHFECMTVPQYSRCNEAAARFGGGVSMPKEAAQGWVPPSAILAAIARESSEGTP
jgi:hypothetical protein